MKTTLMAHNVMSHDPLSSNLINDNDAKTILFPSSVTPPFPDTSDILAALRTQGWILLRGQHYDVETFSQLMRQLCQTLTYDPARQNITSEAQKWMQARMLLAYISKMAIRRYRLTSLLF